MFTVPNSAHLDDEDVVEQITEVLNVEYLDLHDFDTLTDYCLTTQLFFESLLVLPPNYTYEQFKEELLKFMTMYGELKEAVRNGEAISDDDELPDMGIY